jgi:acetyl-CoA carboxylase carboxyltransferase component
VLIPEEIDSPELLLPAGDSGPREPGPPSAGGTGLAETGLAETGLAETGLAETGLAETGPVTPSTTSSSAVAVTRTVSAQVGRGREVVVRTGPLSYDGRPVVTAQVQDTERGRGLTGEAVAALASAAELALERRSPFVVVLSSAGLDLSAGVAALDGWGRVARAVARCSGVVPVVVVVSGPVLSGPALLLGMADAVVMTARSLSYVSGPAAVAEVTGLTVSPDELGGPSIHASRTGLATLAVTDDGEAMAAVADLLGYLPAHSDELPPVSDSDDPSSRPTPELREVVPASSMGSYDVRRVISAVADDGAVLELRPLWAPQLVTALVRVAGQPVGVLANQPQAMAGTLDIAASQKGARFVAFCDSFNVPLLTVVDTPGFMPGRDLEWRGVIRHGAELVFAYAEATVPRICLVVRKAYGGAYIVMDSKAMGNDLCVAWPGAELAVMGAEQAVKIVHRREDEETQAKLAVEYGEKFLNPYIAAERGYVDMVIDPADTRQVIARCLAALQTKRERLVGRKHGNSPL